MERDVLFGPAPGVGLQPEPQAFIGAHQGKAGKSVEDRRVADLHKVHESLQIGRGPAAIDIGFAEPKVAIADKAGENVGVANRNLDDRAGLGALDTKDTSIRQAEIEAAAFQPGSNVKDGTKIARQVGLTFGCGQKTHLVLTRKVTGIFPEHRRSLKPFVAPKRQARACDPDRGR